MVEIYPFIWFNWKCLCYPVFDYALFVGFTRLFAVCYIHPCLHIICSQNSDVPFWQTPFPLHSRGQFIDFIFCAIGIPFSVSFCKVSLYNNSFMHADFNPSRGTVAHTVLFVDYIWNKSQAISILDFSVI